MKVSEIFYSLWSIFYVTFASSILIGIRVVGKGSWKKREVGKLLVPAKIGIKTKTSCPSFRISTVKLKISEKAFFFSKNILKIKKNSFSHFFMVAELLSPNRCHWQIAKVKNYNLNVTEVRDSDYKNAFSEIFNFTAGILMVMPPPQSDYVGVFQNMPNV